MSACLVFVFAALLEYAVVNVIERKKDFKRVVEISEKVGLIHFYPAPPPFLNKYRFIF
jgi:hypothetical protein